MRARARVYSDPEARLLGRAAGLKRASPDLFFFFLTIIESSGRRSGAGDEDTEAGMEDSRSVLGVREAGLWNVSRGHGATL